MERIMTYLPSKKEISRFLAIALCLCLCLSVFMASTLNVAFCDPTTGGGTGSGGTTGGTSTMAKSITDIITLGASKIYSIFRAIVIPIVICIIGYCGLLLLGGGPQSVNKAKTTLIGCFIGAVFIVFSPLIGNEVGEWLNSSSGYSGDLGDYNPLA